MSTEAIRETWQSFWGELLFLRFHESDSGRWTKREQRAAWLIEALELPLGARILDLGCGDGIHDICLARLGMQVTAVDRIGTLLEAARRELDGGKVLFIHDDLRRIAFPDASFDAVLMLDMIGLMDREADATLFGNAARWLAPGGHLVVDCPADRTEGETCFTREFEDGVCEIRSDCDPTSRLLHVVPIFRRADGRIVELHDPYAPEGRDGCGVFRYLYPKPELSALLSGTGFRVREVQHYWGEGHYLLLGEFPFDHEKAPPGSL